ncbi:MULTISPECIES: GNAT family N-acetyltransferase [unclassified Nocardia]|uniref:GNAT family N-acetyltransferase n=1 Tax=unclassified Nocardia TaxID=2637762 RepID=UPI001CE41F67|nr:MULTISPECIES: GNAT family N-acetyltransferase [unclassified Nocardia]
MPLLTEPVVPAGNLARLAQPSLKVDELVLRPWQPTDVRAVVAAYAEPDIQRWHMRSMTGEEASSWIAQWPHRWTAESGAGWAVTDGADVLGQISLRKLVLAEGLSAISYWVLPSARGRAVASRALSELTRWAFDELGLHRIEVAHSTSNPASCRVAERAGYPWEGTKRRQARHADGWHDMHLHARLADDHPA